jgi:hypothetical protein
MPQATPQFFAAKTFSLGRIPMGQDSRAGMCGIGSDHGKATLERGASAYTRSQRNDAWKL